MILKEKEMRVKIKCINIFYLVEIYKIKELYYLNFSQNQGKFLSFLYL